MSDDNCSKISIIVPVYNTMDYLGPCIESILNQTYTHLELLLIDDGSKDESGAICDAYAQKDSRVIVFHRENAGVSKTRNFGMEQVSGDYILFVDSDDLLHPDYIVKLYNAIPKKQNDVISMCQAQLLVGETYTNRTEALVDYNKGRVPLYQQYLEPLVTRKIQGSICRVLYPAKLLQKYHSTFIPCKIAEDLLFFMEVLSHCQEVRVCEEHLYIYRQIQTSSSHKAYITNYLPDRLLYMKKLNEILKAASLEESQYQWLMSYSFQFYRTLLYMNATAAPDSDREIQEIDASPFGTMQVSKNMEKQFREQLDRKHKILNFMVMHRLFVPIRMMRNLKRAH